MTGRLAEATELCETALEAVRLSASPHELYRALFELGWTRYYAGDLDGALAAFEESARVDPRLAGGTIPNAGGGPGWGLGVVLFEARRGRARARRSCSSSVDATASRARCRWSAASTGRASRSSSSRPATSRRPTPTRAAPRRTPSASGCSLPAALAGPHARGRAARARRRARGGGARPRRLRRGRRLDRRAAPGGVLARPRRAARSRPRASAEQAIATLRDAEAELDACGSLRVRDELRRELRKLGARAESRGPAAAGDTGIASLTKRELEIAELATDRKTNREIAAALFLSDKTVESHMRNIFHKLGVSSRVEVARAVERERREREAAQT